jgi:hypothetical protein
VGLLRRGNAGSNTAANYIKAAKLAWPSCQNGYGGDSRPWSVPTLAAAPTRESPGSPTTT